MEVTPLLLNAGLGLVLAATSIAAPKTPPNPDFTQGEALPGDVRQDWTLGASGASGWMHAHKQSTLEARQVYITEVLDGSPADGQLRKGDVLLGVAGRAFSYCPRQEIGRALTVAEATDGKLMLTRWRDAKREEITLQLRVLGSYSDTAPYDCPKSKIIMDEGCEALAQRMAGDDYKQNPITRSLNGLGLLASGDSKYHRLLKKEAEWAADYSVTHMATWYYGYVTLFLAEYVLATGDESVLPGLRRIAMEAAKGQSHVGSWGHKFADPTGRLVGYGMMNSPGAVMTIGLVLAREAGVKDPEVATAIDRSATLLRFYTGKGAVPYGDHAPYMSVHEDNGKCGMTAVLFDQLGEEKPARFFSRMSLASHGSERDTGHTGNFFNMTWAMPGIALSGPQATGAWMEEFGHWYFDLARSSDWSFTHQGQPNNRGDAYNNWDATGLYLIAYGMPRRAIRLTGSKPPVIDPLSAEQAEQIVRDGRGFTAYDHNADKAYADLPPDILLQQLASWSPVVRERAAKALARHKNMPIEPLIGMLDDPSVVARQGACTGLASFGSRAAPAVAKLRELLKAEDMWLRVKAAEALAAIGEPSKAALPQLLEMLAVGPTEADPRGMEQRYLANALFHPREGMLRGSLDGVDRDKLLAAVRSGLRNEDGRTRGTFKVVYNKLDLDELAPLMPDIHRAIVEKSPSGIMFDGTIQQAGLELFSSNRISEGIELIANHVWKMKPHGSENRIDEILALLEPYGAHAQRAIPILERAITYFEEEEEDFPKHLSQLKAKKTREAIERIRSASERPELMHLRNLAE